MKINICQFENYREQLCAEQLAWHEANTKPDQRQITAFVAGFNDGWRQLLSALKLHAGVTTDAETPAPSYNRHQIALDVQNAGNLRALAREFVKVVDHADNELRSTKAVWDDSAVVLFVNKFESLCRSDARFSAAYKVCNEKVTP